MNVCKNCQKRLRLEEDIITLDAENCELCCGLLNHINDYFNIFLNETKEIEFSKFLLGVETIGECFKRDLQTVANLCPECRNFKQEFTFQLGGRIEEVLGKKVDFKEPELTFKINQETGDYSIWIKPIYIAGRYKKMRRGIPQSPWINSAKGREGEKSISEYIGISALKLFRAKDYNFFASGREDVDALMLGNGRPFYVEISKPLIRSADLKELETSIKEYSRNGIEVIGLHLASKEEIEELKNSKYDKVYEVGISLEKEEKSIDEILDKIRNIEIEQQTPNRVLGIRKDKLRKRRIYEVNILKNEGKRLVLIIKAEAGTYIKEFITGDNGRTKPSMSEMLGVNIQIEYLNVLEVN
mgnify:CR=1 FL=1